MTVSDLTAARRVIVKFRNELEVPRDDSGRLLDRARWVGTALARLPWRHLFQSVSDQQLQTLINRAQANHPGYDPPNFRSYYVSVIPPQEDLEAIAATLRARQNAAYVESTAATPPSLVSPGDDPLALYQRYLDPADVGIDAEFAWTVEGGDGKGIGFVDLEQGWALDHRDLAAHKVHLISGKNKMLKQHGTGTLGVVASVDNHYECLGITPNLDSVQCVSQWRPDSTSPTGDVMNVASTAEAMMDAVVVMKVGDVLLLEAQTTLHYPVEIEQAIYDEIELATKAGIVVVQCAGNGKANLDNLKDAAGKTVFDPSSGDYRDSGAIIVGAAVSTTPHSRASFSNYGKRVNCYAWGDSIVTLSTNVAGTNLTAVTYAFNGTSGAGAIVAGAAISVQGMANSHLGGPYQPSPLRDLLSSPTWNTASASPADEIGVMPNLRGIIGEMKILD